VLAQGLSRRVVGRVGQRKVVLFGFLTAAVAFLLVAVIPTPVPGGVLPAWGKPVFFLGMGLISFATGLILPSVSSLVSLYSDATEQGRNLGILRSAGSLARVIGPISAALLYFHFGSHFWVYIVAAALMLPAFLIVRNLPDPQGQAGAN
jgi:MFS family permease